MTWHPYVKAVAARHMVRTEDIYGRSLKPRIVRARHELWATLRCFHGLSYTELGAVTGHDHTTAISGVRRHWERWRRRAA